MMTTLSSVKTG